MDETFLRIEAVKAATGLSRSTIWRLEREGRFPQHLRISPRAIAWRSGQIRAWIAAQIAAAGIQAGGD